MEFILVAVIVCTLASVPMVFASTKPVSKVVETPLDDHKAKMIQRIKRMGGIAPDDLVNVYKFKGL
jgi:hypothetical protein